MRLVMPMARGVISEVTIDQHKDDNGDLAALFMCRCDRGNRHDEREGVLHERHSRGLVIALQSRIEVRPGIHCRERDVNHSSTQKGGKPDAERRRGRVSR